jgi:hypothetical protein
LNDRISLTTRLILFWLPADCADSEFWSKVTFIEESCQLRVSSCQEKPCEVPGYEKFDDKDDKND